jgi:hypothetical protein
MLDYYFQSNSENAIFNFAKQYINVIGPKKGKEAIPASIDEDGTELPGIPAVGDPTIWYVCIRNDKEIINLPSYITECDVKLGISVLGVWA